MFGGEEGVVDLAAPGVHGADHQGVHVGHVPGHGLQGGDGRAGLVRGKGQSLGSRDADADAGEGPRACRHSDGVAVLDGQAGVFQHGLHNGHQGAAVGEAGVLIAGAEDFPILRDGSGDCFGGGFQCQDPHRAAPPSTVMLRQPSCSGWRVRVT